MDTRDKIKDLIKKNISTISDIEIEDMERGIYNWAIEYADEHCYIKNWKCLVFKKMYVEKARSIISNLSSNSYLKNAKLIERLKENEFAPHDLAFMKPENMFPDQWAEVVGDFLRTFEYAYEEPQVATTDIFQCKRCKKKECTFYNMQIRAGDEGETIFIRCLNCGFQFRQG